MMKMNEQMDQLSKVDLMIEVIKTEEVIVENLESISQEEMLNVIVARKKDISQKTVPQNHRMVADHLEAVLNAGKWAIYLLSAKEIQMIKELAVIEEEVAVEIVKVMTIVMEEKTVRKQLTMDRHTSPEMMIHKLMEIEE